MIGTSHKWTSAKQTTAYGHNARVFDVSFSPADTSLLASASDDDTAKVWRLHSEQGSTSATKQHSRGKGASAAHSQVASFHGHEDSVLRVSWAPDGCTLATASADTTVRLWRFDGAAAVDAGPQYAAEEVARLEGHAEEVYGCEFLVAGSALHMATGSAESVFLWDAATGARLAEAGAPDELRGDVPGAIPERWQPGYIFSLAAQPGQARGEGTLLAACCSDGSLRAWAREGSSLTPLTGVHLRTAMGSACAWDPDGRCLACSFSDGSIVITDVRTWKVVWEAHAGGAVLGCCYLPGLPHRLAAATPGGRVSLFNVTGASQQLQHSSNDSEGRQHQQPASTLQAEGIPPRQLLCVACAADGSAIAASGNAAVLDAKSASISSSADTLAKGEEDDGLFSRHGLERALGRQADVYSECGVPPNRQSKWSPIHLWHSAEKLV